jgi:hypothetical protein
MVTVYFEDDGQDFLEWDIQDGKVVDCRPFQSWCWNGTLVHNYAFRKGTVLDITLKDGRRTTLKHKVEEVVLHK